MSHASWVYYALTACTHTIKSTQLKFSIYVSSCLLPLPLPDWSFIMRMALALASSSAVTHLCRSTSVLAFRWYVRPPLLRTMLQASSVSMCAVAKLIVPRHVWAISACVLQQNRSQKKRRRETEREKDKQTQERAEDTGIVPHLSSPTLLTFIRPISTSKEARKDREMPQVRFQPSSSGSTLHNVMKHTPSL